MKKLLLLTIFLVASVDVNAGGLTAKSLDALKKYCIPKPEAKYDGTTVCGSEFEGIYNGKKDGNTCGCWDNQNLIWDPELRHCKVKCDMGGTFPRLLRDEEVKNGMPCPEGYHPLREMKRNK